MCHLSGLCKGWKFAPKQTTSYQQIFTGIICLDEVWGFMQGLKTIFCFRLSKLHHFFCNQIFFQKQKVSQKFEVLSWLVLVILLIAFFVMCCQHLFQITNLIIWKYAGTNEYRGQ